MKKAIKIKGYDGIFSTRLRELMEDNQGRGKTTQEELAKATGITRQTISQYMDGSVLPNIERVYFIAKYFDVSSDYLIFGTKSKKSDNQEINSRLGLSDDTIKILETWAADKGDSRNIELLNYFFKNGLISELIPDFKQGLDKLCIAELSGHEIKLENLVEIIKIKIGGKILKKLDESFDEYLPKCKRDQDEWLPSALPENTSARSRGEML